MVEGMERWLLKREEYKHTKHDPLFSKWEILIGPSDWENNSLGMDGVERYRVHNLPIGCSCPGLYELGIAACHTDVGRSVRKLDPRLVVAVYLGQADNIRTRLQHYGRAGSHLDHGSSVCPASDDKSPCFQKGPGLFREIFSKGFPMVFRWAPMKNKKEAEKTEALLLSVFDYAWNKGGNGTRRRDDILRKLDEIAAGTTNISNLASKFQHWKWKTFGIKRVGIQIEGSMPSKDLGNTPSDPRDDVGLRAFKFSRSQPQVVAKKPVADEDFTMCGVALGDGSVCRNRPIEGRKRCGEHKGQRINGSQPQVVAKKSVVDEDFTMCGVALGDGSVCRNRPIEGRKRCGEHKGKRINGSNPRLVAGREGPTWEGNLACGVSLEDGSICMKIPVSGRKRCVLHKGRRI